MNIMCIFLCVYFVTTSVLRWIKSEGKFDNFLHFNSQYTVVHRNQSTATFTYSVQQLTSIGELVKQHRNVNKIDPSVCHRINKLKIGRRKKRQRGKRGGQRKIISRPVGTNPNHLVSLKKYKNYKQINEKVSCITLNCRSTNKKDTIIGQYLREEDISFALLTETWFSDNKQHQYETSDLNQNGYKISTANRKEKVGGGIALTCKDKINMLKIKSGTYRSFEFGIWKLIFRNITLFVIGIYRPPSLSTDYQFIDDFLTFSEGILSQYSNLMFMGDFNIHIVEDGYAVQDFNNCIYAMGLDQHVNFSTHVNGNCLDLVITEAIHGVEVLKCDPGPFISDHCVIKVTINVKKENIISQTRSFRNYKKIDHTEFGKDLSSLSIDCDDVNDYVTIFEGEIIKILDKHTPVVEKTSISRKPKPWFNDKILNQKRVLRRREFIWKKYREDHQYTALKEARNKYIYEINCEKRSTLSEKVISAKGNSKKLYQLVSEITGTKSENPMPPGKGDNILAEEFAEYFMNKISKIRDSLKDYPNYKPLRKEISVFDHFVEFSEAEIKMLISELNTKSCEIDILPASLLKMHLDKLLPVITKLVNLSLQQGVFPEKWKEAVIRPLLKKSGLELDCVNYRPVSNLTFLSKLIEKAVLLRLNNHCNDYNLLPKNQSAYRRFHSCETALLRLMNDLLDGMEKQEVNALIAIDLSAAFDTVDHDILLDVLQNQYGVHGTALSWVDSYLRPRKCRINVGSAYSTSRVLQCSVPQGSCSGPWFYLTYAGTLFDEIPPTISVYGFADDHIANKRFCPSSPKNEIEAIKQLEQCALTINDWMNNNKLKMNTKKTEFILFGSRAQLNKCNTKEINIAGDTVGSVNCIRYLGAWLDSSLNLKHHVKMKCRTAMLNYLRIKSIRKYLTQDAAETLVLTLVISHLDYCNVILYGIAECDINKMQRIQSMCAKLVLSRGKFESSKQALYDLHWLPIKARITFKLLTVMYNCTVGNAPEYLTELLSKQYVRREGLRSNKNQNTCFIVPFNKRKTFSDRSLVQLDQSCGIPCQNLLGSLPHVIVLKRT